MDAKRRWTFLNATWSALTGHSVSDSLNVPAERFIHPKDRQDFVSCFQAVLSGHKESCHSAARVISKDGSAIRVAWHTQRIFDRKHRTVGLSGTIFDISEQQAADRAWVEEKERAQVTLSSIGDGVITTDLYGRIQDLNPAAEVILAVSTREARGKALHELASLLDESSEQPIDDSAFNYHSSSPSELTLRELILVNRSRRRIALTIKVSVLRGLNQEAFGRVMVLHDVSDQRALQRELEYQATHDALTGLINRNALREIMRREHAQCERTRSHYSALLIDLDHFKTINDLYGHAVGDSALIHATRLFRKLLRDGDWIGRWGGEEFLCLLPNTSKATAWTIAERLRSTLEDQPIDLHEETIKLTASIGIATYPQNGVNIDDILVTADSALYSAKRGGRNRVKASTSSSNRPNFSLGGEIEYALRKKHIFPAYQPVVDISNGKLVAQETLARLVTDDGNVLPASAFIEVASRLHLVHHIDHLMIRQVLEDCAKHLAGGSLTPHFVNVSAHLLRHRKLVEDLLRTATEQYRMDLSPTGAEKPIVLEITEREFLRDMDETRRILEPFIDFGLRLAIDDFGNGYSSFRYLTDLPVSYLKIEGDLVRRCRTDARVRAIIRGVQEIARELELITIGEYVEDQETADLLRDIGINWGQGFWFGEPTLIRREKAVSCLARSREQ